MKGPFVQFLGSGDAFGCGGRFQPCIYVQGRSVRFLLDCGASSLIAMKRFAVDPGRIDIILLSHLHGDHFGGIPFLVRETQILGKRTAPLSVAGPAGLERRIGEALENFFPGSGGGRTFPLTFTELSDGAPNRIGPLGVWSYPAVHTPGTEARVLRVEFDGRVIAYSGDTEWSDGLIRAAAGADLFICECFTLQGKKNHLDYGTLLARRGELRCRRIILTHMSDDVLARLPGIEFDWAEDGKIVALEP